MNFNLTTKKRRVGNSRGRNPMGVGTVTMPGQEPVLTMAPDRFAALKLRNAQTSESIMTFEETAPPGADTTMHLHRGSDETCYVSGEITFRIGDAVMVGGPAHARLCPATNRMRGRTPARNQRACCSSTRRVAQG